MYVLLVGIGICPAGSALTAEHDTSCSSAHSRRVHSALAQRPHRSAGAPHWLQSIDILWCRVSAAPRPKLESEKY